MMFEREALFELLREAKRLQPKAEKLGWTIPDIGFKLSEEYGEFAEAVQIQRGMLPHKEKEHEHAPFEEAADVLGCMLDILVRLYGDTMPPSQIYVLFLYWVDRKAQKWINRVEADYAELSDESK